MEFLDVCVDDENADASENLSDGDEEEEDEEEDEEDEEDEEEEIIYDEEEEDDEKFESESSEDPSHASEMDDFIVADYAPMEYTRLKKRTNRTISAAMRQQS